MKIIWNFTNYQIMSLTLISKLVLLATLIVVINCANKEEEEEEEISDVNEVLNIPDIYPCQIKYRDARRAIANAKTVACKAYLANITCQLQNGTMFAKTQQRTCPLRDKDGTKYMGCYLQLNEDGEPYIKGMRVKMEHKLTIERCSIYCLRNRKQIFAIWNSQECACGDMDMLTSETGKELLVGDNRCKVLLCHGNNTQWCGGANFAAVYTTGFGKIITPQQNKWIPSEFMNKDVTQCGEGKEDDTCAKPVRILFLWQLNGRNIRQLKRMLKLIYRPYHFYHVHIDQRMNYLYTEMLKLESILGQYNNFYIARKRYIPVWGSSIINQVNYDGIEYASRTAKWNWDYMVKISESDFPLVPVERLEDVLRQNWGFSFVAFDTRDLGTFFIDQGVNTTFVECDGRIWKVGNKNSVMDGLIIAGGSDWVTVTREFGEYVALSQDEIMVNIRRFNNFTMLSPETLWHMVRISGRQICHICFILLAVLNTHFCDKFIDGNNKIINWDKARGCKCQHKHLVDWCGCSPAAFRKKDWPRISSTVQSKTVIFGRKFESIIDIHVLELAEKLALDNHDSSVHEHPSFNRTWINIFDAAVDKAKDNPVTVLFTNILYDKVWEKAFGDKEISCAPKLDKQYAKLHVYKASDTSETKTLMELKWSCGDVDIAIEALIQRQQDITCYSGGRFEWHRLQNLIINNHFDVKEFIFRDYIGLVSHNREVAVRFDTRHDLSDDEEEREVQLEEKFTILVHWLPPESDHPVITRSYTFGVAKTGIGVHYAVFDLPLLDEKVRTHFGVWRVQLIAVANVSDALICEMRLPIIDENQVSKLTDQHTIDTLRKQYTIEEVCCPIMNKLCAEQNIPLCSTKVWSSWYDDPKSNITIGLYDPKTKTLV